MKNDSIQTSDDIVISDDKLFHFNFGKKDNQEKSLLYKGSDEIWHIIDFDTCARNYRENNQNSNVNCIGERNSSKLYLTFYTSGMLTRVDFKENYYSNINYDKLLSGARKERFAELIKIIEKAGYTTFEFKQY